MHFRPHKPFYTVIMANSTSVDMGVFSCVKLHSYTPLLHVICLFYSIWLLYISHCIMVWWKYMVGCVVKHVHEEVMPESCCHPTASHAHSHPCFFTLYHPYNPFFKFVSFLVSLHTWVSAIIVYTTVPSWPYKVQHRQFIGTNSKRLLPVPGSRFLLLWVTPHDINSLYHNVLPRAYSCDSLLFTKN